MKRKIATTQIKRKRKKTNGIALKPGERMDIGSEGITIIASGDNSGVVFVEKTKRGYIAKSHGIGDGITVSLV